MINDSILVRFWEKYLGDRNYVKKKNWIDKNGRYGIVGKKK